MVVATSPPSSGPIRGRWRLGVLLATAALGLLLFVWGLGSTGLPDETPPLFAASARAMAETGDWLIPRVNGLARYDKPPLVYWLMGALYRLPGQPHWDPLGTWAASLPSALAALATMVALAATLLEHPQGLPAGPEGRRQGAFTALAAALAFGLSPLVLIWARTPVSDALFTATLALALLLLWAHYAAPTDQPLTPRRAPAWWGGWLLLALAVLSKGPVALVLTALTLALFAWSQGSAGPLLRRLRPLPGLALTLAVAAPWYGLALLREGRPYWESFFGYHNLQRFTAVVNHHLSPWWFFGPILLLASLPVSPLLLLGLGQALGRPQRQLRPWRPVPAPQSLGRFAACWLLAVLLFFTAAATKLPSYWLPATPAAALLIALTTAQAAGQGAGGQTRPWAWAWGVSLLLGAVVGAGLLAAPLWTGLIQDRDMPTLGADLLRSGIPLRAGVTMLAAVGLGLLQRRRPLQALVGLQLVLVLVQPLALLPAAALADQLRAAPVRHMAAAITQASAQRGSPNGPVAMVGVRRPSLHFYSRHLVLYETHDGQGLVDLADRLAQEQRPGLTPTPPRPGQGVLVVIDNDTAALPHWQGLEPQLLARDGIFRLWRLDRQRLAQRAAQLQQQGLRPVWRQPVPERF